MKKQKLNLEFDIPNLVIAMFLLIEHRKQEKSQKKIQKRYEEGKLSRYSEISIEGLNEKEKQEILNGRKHEAKKEEGIFHYSFMYIGYKEERIINILTYFLLDELLEKIIATKYKALNSIDRELVEVREVEKSDIKKLTPLDIPTPFIESKEFEEAEENDEYWEYEIKVNSSKLEKFVKENLKLWEESKFYTDSKNIRKSEVQLKGFVEELFKQLNSYPREGLIIEYEFDEKFYEDNKEEWFLSCLFLEKIKLIEISEIRIYRTRVGTYETIFLFIKINILDDFFDTFESIENIANFDFKQLISGEKSVIKKKEFQPIINLSTSTLSVKKYKIPIRKMSNQYHLLSVLNKDVYKNWEFSEVAEIIDREGQWKKWYNVADAIKKKVAIETNGEVKDFLITTTSAVQINPEYI
ncbi:MAG: hypothetical protein K9M51_03895 [Candidatus Gracilibacteria bacterium]|nr:hypothetical protein [Candidatus Gracilibacteria bacterium]